MSKGGGREVGGCQCCRNRPKKEDDVQERWTDSKGAKGLTLTEHLREPVFQRMHQRQAQKKLRLIRQVYAHQTSTQATLLNCEFEGSYKDSTHGC